MLFLGGHLGDIGNILNFGHIGNYFAEIYSASFFKVWIWSSIYHASRKQLVFEYLKGPKHEIFVAEFVTRSKHV